MLLVFIAILVCIGLGLVCLLNCAAAERGTWWRHMCYNIQQEVWFYRATADNLGVKPPVHYWPSPVLWTNKGIPRTLSSHFICVAGEMSWLLRKMLYIMSRLFCPMDWGCTTAGSVARLHVGKLQFIKFKRLWVISGRGENVICFFSGILCSVKR
jgi:hypothetical protein